MSNQKKLPKVCPSCGGGLHVQAMCCEACDTRIEGSFPLPQLMRLSEEDQQFVLDFVMCSGSLKEMAAQSGVTYPTVRLRLDRLIQKIRLAEQADADPYIGLVKQLAMEDKLDFDTAKLLIQAYKRQKEG